MQPRDYRTLDDVLAEGVLPQAALLLWRTGRHDRLGNRAIGVAGRGEWCHVSMAANFGLADGVAGLPWRDLAMVQFRGFCDEPLADQVARYPGRLDVFAPCGSRVHPAERAFWKPDGVVDQMLGFVDAGYGYAAVALAAAVELPVIRWWAHRHLQATSDADPGSGWNPHCAMAYQLAVQRATGLDPVPNLDPRLTSPADLARSPWFDYLFTLTTPDSLERLHAHERSPHAAPRAVLRRRARRLGVRLPVPVAAGYACSA